MERTTGERGGGALPCVDGLRAVAALGVVGVHTAFVSGFTTRHRVLGAGSARLEVGVAVFFVISGFLLYRPFALAGQGLRPVPAARAFWLRRALRIVPAYWLAFVVVTYVLRADTVVHGRWSWVVYLGFLQVYSPHYVLTGLTQAWTLCAEVGFYLALPAYARLLRRRARTGRSQVRAELAGLAVVGLVSVAFRLGALAAGGSYGRTAVNWLPGYGDLFALGMLLAVATAWWASTGGQPRWAGDPRLPAACWAGAALAYVAVSSLDLNRLPVYQPSVASALGRQELYGLVAVLLVAPAVLGPQDAGVVRAALRHPVARALGVVSYGIYLWHEAWILLYVRWTGDRLFSFPWWELAAAVVALATATAALSWVVLERPAQGLAHRRPRSAPGVPAALAAAVEG